MKRSRARLALALLAALIAGPAGGAAGGFIDRSGDGDARRRYADCTALIASNPGAAFDSALAWRYEACGAPAWHCVGLSLVALGYHAEAGEVFERMAEDMAPGRDSLRAQVLGQAGQAWLQAGEPGRARAVLDAALELDPVNPELLIDRAQAGSMSLARGPLSPPTITQSRRVGLSRKLAPPRYRSTSSRSGSAEINRTAAGVSSRRTNPAPAEPMFLTSIV